MKTTVIGLGAMGAGMAGNLFRAGHLSQAWNRTRARAEAAAAQHGFDVADSLEQAAGEAELELPAQKVNSPAIVGCNSSLSETVTCAVP